MRSCLLFSLLLHSLLGGEGRGVAALWLGLGPSQLIPPSRHGGGGGSAEIPTSQPSPMLARSPPLPGPSELLVRDSRSHSRSSGGLRRERSRSCFRAARSERYQDRSRLMGSRVRTRVSRSRFTGCSRSCGRDRSSSRSPSVRLRSRRRRSLSSDRYRCSEVRSRSRSDLSVPVALAVVGPHVSVPAPVGSLAGLVTDRGHGRGINGTGVRITGNMGGVVLPRMFTVILGPV